MKHVLRPLAVATVLATSAILYHGVERPAQRWINAIKLPRPAGTKTTTAH